MNDLISTAILIAILVGGTVAADRIYMSIRKEALTKAAVGLPNLAPFAARLSQKDIDVATIKIRPKKESN